MTKNKKELIGNADSVRYEILYDLKFNLKLSDVVRTNFKNIKEDQDKLKNDLYK